MTLTNDEKFALLQDMKVIDNNRKIVERLKKRIEELNEVAKEDFDSGHHNANVEFRIEELQKILGEKKSFDHSLINKDLLDK